MRGNQRSLPANWRLFDSSLFLIKFMPSNEAWSKRFSRQSTLEFAFPSPHTQVGTHTREARTREVKGDVSSSKLNWRQREDRNCLSNENICWRDLSAESEFFICRQLYNCLSYRLLIPHPQWKIENQAAETEWVAGEERWKASDSLSSLGFILFDNSIAKDYCGRWNRTINITVAGFEVDGVG